MSQKIICPNCKFEIDLDKLSEERYKNLLEEQELKLKKQQIEKQKEFEKKLEKEKEEMREKAKKWAEEKAKEQAKKDALEMEDLKNRLKEQEQKAEEMKKNELEMRRKQREIEEKSKNFDLEMEKKLIEEKRKMEESMAKMQDEALEIKMKQVQEEFRKKELEYQKQQEQLKKSLDDAKRKAEQWSQQIQWDIQEDDLKNAISLAFPIDKVEDVPTWIKWADLIQSVNDNLWQSCWTIIWESKNTKAWTPSWISKLKDDKIKIWWSIAIIVTNTLPKNIKNFWFIDEIVVCSPEYTIPVCSILRDKLLSIAKVERSLEWKDMKMEMLYKYLRSEEFGSKVSSIIDVFTKLKWDIDVERRAMERIWKRREKELERAVFSTTMMYWELEWLMWQSLPWSEKLELWMGED